MTEKALPIIDVDDGRHAEALAGQRVWQVLLEIEALAANWVLHDVPQELHTYGRLPGEEEIRAWQIPRSTGVLLFYLVQLHGIRSVLEIGTSLGYSALWLGAALERNNGHLTTCDIFQPKLELAEHHIDQSGLSNITVLKGEAKNSVASWERTIDMLFLDADPESYDTYLDHLEPSLRQGALLVMDNAVNHSSVTEGFSKRIMADQTWDSWLLPIDNGLLIAIRK